MSCFILFVVMLVLHLLADFTLQGWFANGKHRVWWEQQCAKQGVDFSKYRYDYICALVSHSFFWAAVTFLPMIVMTNWPYDWLAVVFLTVQVIVHAVVDDLKANKFKLNLVQDQLVHVLQVAVAAAIYGLL